VGAAATYDEVLGFIDVPGRGKFIHTITASSIDSDCVLLTIAADDGFMSSTEERLDILRLLGVTAGVIASTKLDAARLEPIVDLRAQLCGVLSEAAVHWPVLSG